MRRSYVVINNDNDQYIECFETGYAVYLRRLGWWTHSDTCLITSCGYNAPLGTRVNWTKAARKCHSNVNKDLAIAKRLCEVFQV